MAELYTLKKDREFPLNENSLSWHMKVYLKSAFLFGSYIKS
jgi:hypothetical protein